MGAHSEYVAKTPREVSSATRRCVQGRSGDCEILPYPWSKESTDDGQSYYFMSLPAKVNGKCQAYLENLVMNMRMTLISSRSALAACSLLAHANTYDDKKAGPLAAGRPATGTRSANESIVAK